MPLDYLQTIARTVEQPGDSHTTGFGIIGHSPQLQTLREQISMYAGLPFPVLIEGESGTGKELVANAIRKLSRVDDADYQAVNCGALAPSLIEATLFGHRKGAFTGATESQPGFFDEGKNRLLFLDEIGELPQHLQTRLLRVLENGEFHRVGENIARHSQTRIIAATNRTLQQDVQQGSFRSDLYYRLNILSIKTPALRQLDPKDKLTQLAYFRQDYHQTTQLPIFQLDGSAIQFIEHYPFPGNTRELRNLVIRLYARYSGKTISRRQIQAEIYSDQHPAANEPTETEQHEIHIRQQLQQGTFHLNRHLQHQERRFIQIALQLSNGNISQAAKMLGIKRTTLHSRMNKHDDNELSYQ